MYIDVKSLMKNNIYLLCIIFIWFDVLMNCSFVIFMILLFRFWKFCINVKLVVFYLVWNVVSLLIILEVILFLKVSLVFNVWIFCFWFLIWVFKFIIFCIKRERVVFFFSGFRVVVCFGMLFLWKRRVELCKILYRKNSVSIIRMVIV